MLYRIICVAALLCSVTVAARAEKPRTLLLFGDSIIAGYNLANAESISVRLGQLLEDKNCGDVRVVNAGVSGDTTLAGRSRLDWSLKKHSPDSVLLALGGNDMLRGIAPGITEQNLDAMLNTLHEANIPVIFSRVNAPANMGKGYASALNSMYARLSERYNTPLYPFLLEPVFGQARYMQRDGVHPNAAGATVIAEQLAAFIITPDSDSATNLCGL